MTAMQRSASATISLERPRWRGGQFGIGAAQPLAALAALTVLVWGDPTQRGATWPIGSVPLVEAVLGLGLVAAWLAAGSVAFRFAQSLTMFAALMLIVWVSNPWFVWPAWPLWAAAGLIALGLLAEPAAHFARGRGAVAFVESASAVGTLFVLAAGHLLDVWGRWPMGNWSLAVALLCLGLLAARFGHDRARSGLATPIATLAALFVLLVGITDTYEPWPAWPLWTIAALLSIGLVAQPVADLLSGRAVNRAAQSIAGIAALFILAAGLLSTGWHVWSMGSIRLAALLVCLGLLAARLADAGAPSRFAQPVATALALVALVNGFLDTSGVTPTWSLWTTIGLLVLALAVGLFPRPRGGLSERVLAERVDQLRRTRRGALDVQASELRRIERDLHDGAQVRLVALSMKLGRAEDRYCDDPEIAALLREAREDTGAAIRDLRELARGIAPPVLTDRGIEAAVNSLAQRSGAEVTVSGKLDRRPPPAVETAAYFVVAESLTNAAKHAPGARVEVRLDERGGDLFVEITDFGPGGANPAGGGLTGLRQRAEALDGALHVTSPAGVGTHVEAVLPCGW